MIGAPFFRMVGVKKIKISPDICYLCDLKVKQEFLLDFLLLMFFYCDEIGCILLKAFGPDKKGMYKSCWDT